MCQQAVKFAGRNSKNRNWENVLNGGATTSGHIDEQRPQLDSARQICPECKSPEVLTVVVDVSTSGEVCWAEFRKSELEECFQWQSHNEWLYGQTEANTGFNASNRPGKPPS